MKCDADREAEYNGIQWLHTEYKRTQEFKEEEGEEVRRREIGKN